MPNATQSNFGDLNIITDCYITIPGFSRNIEFRALPDISDSKNADYGDTPIMGRSSPLKTYSYSSSRSISVQIHYFVRTEDDFEKNIEELRALESAVYPREGSSGAPYLPPPICRIRCGDLLTPAGSLCVVLKSYSVRFPTDVAWDKDSLVPYKFDVDTNWDVVYVTNDLPGQDRIIQTGR